jgi:hypothetical protein
MRFVESESFMALGGNGMGPGLALIVMGLLIFLYRMGADYGLREGWPWMVLALGVGSIFQNSKSLSAWVTTVLGIFILGSRFYSLHISVPPTIKTFLPPVIIIGSGVLWVFRRKKD